ncbi:metal-dependent transcriptional regulator [uncultured Faecalicoccus sp.]|uniref:metal-dependent transcriptional regulator n=1 Tax=uncultured Faecalicoccus sp. TaxID=1971760 RepID=UPI00260DF2F6|nr:metal-dependent transcriptional regulator [uncultured Faecalicoccus sp.]
MKKIEQSKEDYLEAIYVLGQKIEAVHNIDIASFLGFSKSSVSSALKKLRQENLIQIDERNVISLTKEGEKVAVMMDQRHRFFTDMLIKIGVDPQIAQEDACRMEHVISEETFQAILEAFQHQS